MFLNEAFIATFSGALDNTYSVQKRIGDLTTFALRLHQEIHSTVMKIENEAHFQYIFLFRDTYNCSRQPPFS